MKKILCLIILIVLAFILIGCKEQPAENPNTPYCAPFYPGSQGDTYNMTPSEYLEDLQRRAGFY